MKIMRLLMIVLFVSYYCEASLFYHTHYFPWGTVTHSHPYLPSGNGVPMHSHTAAQCDTIAQLTTLLFVVGIFIIAFFNVRIRVLFRPPVVHGRAVCDTPKQQLRAPPAWV